MNRITPKMVADAYVATGLRPMRGDYICADCACAIGALYVEKTGERTGCVYWAESQYGERYVDNFILGFDGGEKPNAKYLTDEDVLAYEDGQDAWESIKHLV